jgi:DNA-binding LacI/PurR family transcriptional regulator
MNDYMAFRVMGVLRAELGLSVPGDVAVIGFDDVPLAAAPEFDLTSVRQPLNRMVEHAIRILMREIELPDPEQVALAPELKPRSSTIG